MHRKICFGVLINLLLISCTALVSMADSAEVLPKGVSRVSLTAMFYSSWDSLFDPDGNTEDIDANFNETLDTNVFPALAALEPAIPPFPGSAVLGNSVVDLERKNTSYEISYQYGMTDKFTVGIVIPYHQLKMDVKEARLDTTNATVGKSVLANNLAPLTGTFAPPDVVTLTTDDIQALLGPGLDINGDSIPEVPGYGLEPFETWEESDIGDIQIGGRYQYLKNDDWRLAFTGVIELPTGKTDDPDNLIDVAFGSGATALGFHFNHDYTGIENLTLNGTFRYILVLPDKEVRRVPDDVNDPITINREKVDRDLGDVVELEFAGNYYLGNGLSIGMQYKYGLAFKTKVDGDLGFAYESLEDETDYTEHILTLGATYSTVPLYMAKKISVPFTLSIHYRNRFDGSNNVYDNEYFALSGSVYF
jgi:hypothetical protein